MTDDEDPYAARRGLTFGQAEGLEPLPTQLALGEVSQAFRVQLLIAILAAHETGRISGGSNSIRGSWRLLLFHLHTEFYEEFPDAFTLSMSEQTRFLSNQVKNASFVKLLGMIQFILSHPNCPDGLAQSVENALRFSRAAYRVVGGGLIVPLASDAEGAAVVRAFDDLQAAELNGARKHLSDAARQLSSGAWAASIRESIHAVESVAKLLEPGTGTLGPALNKLASKGHLHKALKEGLVKLYGYTSDEKGIRHSLLEGGDAKVDETDALYMFGACAAFITYLVGKGRAAGLIK